MNIFTKWVYGAKSESVPSQQSPKFLTTQGLNFYIEKLITEAEIFLYFVTPCFKINKRLQELLILCRQKHVQISVICRTDALKQDISAITDKIKNRNNLHAKCFISEKAILICSINLYDFSQMNNDEMGFYIEKTSSPDMYEEILTEIYRIDDNSEDYVYEENIKNSPVDIINGIMKVGQHYDLEVLNKAFDFDYKKPSGIKLANNEDIFLFMSDFNNYKEPQNGNILYFQGQNTGTAEQLLIYGNKVLYDRFHTPKGKIHLFEKYVYRGEACFAKEPFMKDGKWYFPLMLN